MPEKPFEFIFSQPCYHSLWCRTASILILNHTRLSGRFPFGPIRPMNTVIGSLDLRLAGGGLQRGWSTVSPINKRGSHWCDQPATGLRRKSLAFHVSPGPTQHSTVFAIWQRIDKQKLTMPALIVVLCSEATWSMNFCGMFCIMLVYHDRWVRFTAVCWLNPNISCYSPSNWNHSNTLFFGFISCDNVPFTVILDVLSVLIVNQVRDGVGYVSA